MTRSTTRAAGESHPVDLSVQTLPEASDSEPTGGDLALDSGPITVAREPRTAPTGAGRTASANGLDDAGAEEQDDEALVERIYERLRWRLRDDLRTERERFSELIDRAW